jgi:hypothetical protein
MARQKRIGKGVFGSSDLPVAQRYLAPVSRRRMVLAGGVIFALLLAWAVLDGWLGHGRMLSNGPLSSNHANLASNCGACHGETSQGETRPSGTSPSETRQGKTRQGETHAVTNESCSSCHEKHGDELGVYTFASHYLYRSKDFQRVVPSPKETPCFACHVEHEGRDAEITRVPDARCVSCHAFGSFNRDHPQFDFVAAQPADSTALEFSHTRHVREVMERNGYQDVELSCLSCHHPRDDGKSFQPIRFEQHCDACHLTTSVRTPPLPLRDPARQSAGVETLEDIQNRGGPDARWAYFINPNEFRVQGSRVVKSPLYHRDPWVLDNLRSLRRQLYPQAGLADLLTTSPDVDLSELQSLYTEAIATLEEQARGLRSRPEMEIQDDLERIDALLDQLKSRLEDPYAPLDEARFLLALGPPSSTLSEEQSASIRGLAQALTEPCRQCHTVSEATITRVQRDQRTLRRAEFNHRAHTLQRGCLDCHTEIPILQALEAGKPADRSVDNAGIQNLPHIETCQQCHTPSVASNACVTCHLFHPDTSRRSELRLSIKPAPDASASASTAASEPGS